MAALDELQYWFRSECDGVWEHGSAVQISTLDNPGWSVTIDLAGTTVEGRKFEPVRLGIGKDAVEGSDDWLYCRVENKKFEGRGGPHKLSEILDIFLRWTRGPNQSPQHNADSRPTSGGSPASETPSSPGPRG
jgi:hypothetical protein